MSRAANRPKKYSAAAEYFFSADFRPAEFIFRRIFGGTKFFGGGGQIRRLRGLAVAIGSGSAATFRFE